MTKTISFGIQKGGCSKTTTAGIFAHQCTQNGHRVLAIDMDCQGNLTELLSGKTANEFEDHTVLEAIKEMNAEKYIYPVNDRLHLLAANNLLALLPRHLYQAYGFEDNRIYAPLSKIIRPIQDHYDYIVIDTPPALSEHTLNAFVASDFVVVMFESSNWCYSAIPNFMDTVELAKKLNPKLQIAGILRTLNDTRRYDAQAFNDLVGEEYPELAFETIIKRKATTGRLAIHGFEENKELTDAIGQFDQFYKELMQRVQ